MSVQAVVETMERLNEYHLILLELAERKKEALVHNRVEELNEIVRQENQLLRQVGELDRQRVEAIGQALIQRGYLPNPQITVSDLIRLVFRAEDKKALMNAQQTLLATLGKLRELNKLNQQLIQQSLAYIQYTLDLIIGRPEDEATYRNPADQRRGAFKPLGVFDTRA